MTISTRSRLFQASATFAAISLATTIASCGDDGANDANDGDTSNAQGNASRPSAALPIKELDSTDRATAEFVGKVDGTDIYVAFAGTISADGVVVGSAIYFCDGAKVAGWMHGPGNSNASGIALAARSGPGVSSVAIIGDTVTGTVKLDGTTEQTFTLAKVDADGEAGLYLADAIIDSDLADDERAGWILLPDGTQKGAVRSGTGIVPGTNITANSPTAVVTGRQILLRAIDAIIGIIPF